VRKANFLLLLISSRSPLIGSHAIIFCGRSCHIIAGILTRTECIWSFPGFVTFPGSLHSWFIGKLKDPTGSSSTLPTNIVINALICCAHEDFLVLFYATWPVHVFLPPILPQLFHHCWGGCTCWLPSHHGCHPTGVILNYNYNFRFYFLDLRLSWHNVQCTSKQG
jgi:hypothetical protein